MNTDSDPPIRDSELLGSDCEIVLQNPCRYPEAQARRLRPWIEKITAELAPAARSLAVRFVSDREIRRLNRDFRHQDRPTDVLSFPPEAVAGEPLVEEDLHLGDIVIAVPTARRQAAARGHDVERELRVLLLHGMLHCLGYDHETDDGTMERLEARLLRRLVDGHA